MKTKTRANKLLSALLTMAVMIGLFAEFPQTALAAIPAAPSNLTATAGSDGITLTWTKSASPGVSWVYIDRKQGSGGYSDLARAPYSATSYKDATAEAGKTYTYKVRAYDEDNGFSNYSNEDTATMGVSVIPNPILFKPKIDQQPQSKSVVEGQSAEFKVVASGIAPLEYQWQYKDGTTWKSVPNYPPYSTGEDTPTLKMANLDSTYNNMSLRCKVSNSFGTVDSIEVKLTVTTLGTTSPTTTPTVTTPPTATPIATTPPTATPIATTPPTATPIVTTPPATGTPTATPPVTNKPTTVTSTAATSATGKPTTTLSATTPAASDVSMTDLPMTVESTESTMRNDLDDLITEEAIETIESDKIDETDIEAEEEPLDIDDKETGTSIPWLWSLLGVLGGIFIGCGVAFIAIRKKEKTQHANTSKED